jgi:hypothetical protein
MSGVHVREQSAVIVFTVFVYISFAKLVVKYSTRKWCTMMSLPYMLAPSGRVGHVRLDMWLSSSVKSLEASRWSRDSMLHWGHVNEPRRSHAHGIRDIAFVK